MKKSVKMALATGAVVVVGGMVLAGTSFADGGFGFGPGMRGMGHGPMGFGAVHAQLMKEVDTNGDGKLSQEEIDAAVNARFAEFDADKNGSLSLDEFQALWAQITKPVTVRAFQFLDPNGDASVSKDELDSALGSIVSRFDRNNDGMLSPDDRPQRRGMMGRGRWSDDDGPGRGGRMGHHGRWSDDCGPRQGGGPGMGQGRGRWSDDDGQQRPAMDCSGPHGRGMGPGQGRGPDGNGPWWQQQDDNGTPESGESGSTE